MTSCGMPVEISQKSTVPLEDMEMSWKTRPVMAVRGAMTDRQEFWEWERSDKSMPSEMEDMGEWERALAVTLQESGSEHL